MTVGQLARSGAFLRAARLVRRNFTDGYVVQSIDEEWPGQALDTVLEVIRLAHMGVRAADKLADLAPGKELALDELPLISTLP